MRIKLDENLPLQAAFKLKALGHEVHTTYEEGLSGCVDRQILEPAQREERCLITQDLDFADIRIFAPGEHHGILLIRLSSPSRTQLIERIEELFESENVSSWAGCFVVATERKVRVRRPASRSGSD
jgi:predicted nuclease of predicted toxin-antitoxin system